MRGLKTFEAYWDDLGVARVYLSQKYYGGNTETLTLMCEDQELGSLAFELEVKHGSHSCYRAVLPTLDWDLRYTLEDDRGLKAPLYYGDVVRSDAFDAQFATDAPLGAQLRGEVASFSLWAPTADHVYVKFLEVDGEGRPKESNLQSLSKGERGLWTGAFECATLPIVGLAPKRWLAYRYLVCVNGLCREAQDPYAVTALANGDASVAMEGLSVPPPGIPSTQEISWAKGSTFNPLEAVIYELSIRDFTDQGTYEAMVKDTCALGDRAIGRAYLKALGITHVQLMPFYDFGSVDERSPRKRYNWGYDPVQYFCPEGSLSHNPLDPLARVEGLKAMIEGLHQDGLSVVMDVVYNHMFDKDTSPLELVVPGYYFRVDDRGDLSNGSFCGNDIESRRRMMRRLILDATRHWMVNYGLDGFRFDLMGILDKETMRAVLALVKQLKPSGLVYGEGWNMPTAMPDDQKAIMQHPDQLEGISFFNDQFRDFYKGPTMAEAVTRGGLLTGRRDRGLAWAEDSSFMALFVGEDLSQSIQYMECHDNHTLWDKLNLCLPKLDLQTRKRLQRGLNAFIALSLGIPFFHSGQEWYRTKHGDHNSYRSSDAINGVDWAYAYEGLDGIESFKAALALRRRFKIFKVKSLSEVKGNYLRHFEPKGLLRIEVPGEFKLYFNTTNRPVSILAGPGEWCFATDVDLGEVSEPSVSAKADQKLTLKPYGMRVLAL